MNIYEHLSAKEKIEKFLEKRNKRNNVSLTLIILIASVMMLFIAYRIVMSFFTATSTADQTAILLMLVVGIPFFFLASYAKMEGYKRRNKIYRKVTGLPAKPDLQNYFTNDIKIVNAKFKGFNKRGMVFGNNKEILVEDFQRGVEVFVERTPQKGEQCFLVCLESFELPIAVFIGYYDGQEYLTWDCK